jgi:hypothetical protein
MKSENRVTSLWLLILTLVLVGLTACTAQAGAEVATSSPAGSTLDRSTLAYGLIQLEKEIEPEQAAELLPLWQALRALSGDDTTAPAELAAVLKQIEGTLRPEQLQAITALNITSDQIETWVDQQIVATPEAEEATTSTGGFGGPPGGGFGGPPGGGFGGPPGGGFSSSSSSSTFTSQTVSETDQLLTNYLIWLLEIKKNGE